MFEREGSAPDVLDVDDPAVRRCLPEVRVWVDLRALTDDCRKPRGYEHRPGGVFVGGLARAVMWAQVMCEGGLWLGVVTLELERAGKPVMTAPAVVPQWAITRRRPGRLRGK